MLFKKKITRNLASNFSTKKKKKLRKVYQISGKREISQETVVPRKKFTRSSSQPWKIYKKFLSNMRIIFDNSRQDKCVQNSWTKFCNANNLTTKLRKSLTLTLRKLHQIHSNQVPQLLATHSLSHSAPINKLSKFTDMIQFEITKSLL